MRKAPPIAWVVLGVVSVLTVAVAPSVVVAEGFGAAPAIRSLAGERLEFVIRWGMIPAGRATLEVETAPRERMVLRATARSLQWIDWMYLVRERMESTVTVPGLLPERFFKTTRDGRHRTRVEELLFDRRAGTVTYRRDEQEQASLEVTPGARDALASFYAFRTLDFEGEQV
ncbi:MAG: DUF3108 domain-containing protein, partial [Acidobacteriota bacterium]|nr:DUF3108 domain-containing protein [Acidobacteriota bacterium]